MQAVLSADGRYLDVTLAGRSDLTKVWFPTWSSVNGQDDLRWYEATKQPDGSWTCRVPLANHKSAGGFFLHAYGKRGGVELDEFHILAGRSGTKSRSNAVAGRALGIGGVFV